MTASHSKLEILLNLGKETSGEKRRELLRQVTDAFLADKNVRTEGNYAELDKIISAITADLEAEVRAQLARRLATTKAPFDCTARNLAFDDIEIARPIIECSHFLTETDLLELIVRTSQDHMMAMTKRNDISEKVSDALVDHGEDRVVASLLENDHAKIADATYEKVADRAEGSTVLQVPFVRRASVPLDLLNEFYFKVKADVRREILHRYDKVSADELDAALERSRRRVLKEYGALPEDYETSRGRIDGLERRGELKPLLLVRLMREGRRTEFVFAFAKFTGTDYQLINRLVERQDLDAIAILSRAAGFDRALFVTIAMMIAGQEHRMSNAEEFGSLYQKVGVDTAQRAVRFWKIRAKVENGGTAASHA